MTLKLENKITIAWPPEVLILFEPVVAAATAVLLVSPEEKTATQVDQHEHGVLAGLLGSERIHSLCVLWVQPQNGLDRALEARKLTIACEQIEHLGEVDAIHLRQVHREGKENLEVPCAETCQIDFWRI
eukprot:CAMPEP_0185621666 /NCGR_PEP_ID=MMETSP0436-20130131/58143_1 /TAXON_ID=626734 ORGANISM="Favella taraikaensis, Strain Fe Narragansett Bay" /NCGR_SAMPLE_ID=MMETSP0436 /ASSEMBLY_ACC=CAM_ASM_000390 /LENGTH=128 /DNA_ID=CAMNT_0028263129 /DNA_START=701 /DNA_END=1087 /DNA_ORIENTATION=+